MVEITLPLVLQVLQTVGILVGIVYYLFIMRNSQRTRELALKAQELTLKAQEQALETRQAQLFMNIYTQVYSLEFWNHFREVSQEWDWEDYDDWYDKYESVPEKQNIFNAVGSYFEGMGVLVKRNFIDVTFVDDLLSGPLMSLWQKFEPVILEERRRKNAPTIWEWFGYLYDRVKEVAEKEHGPEHVVDMQRLDRRPESNET
jgi:hypothetical protein